MIISVELSMEMVVKIFYIINIIELALGNVKYIFDGYVINYFPVKYKSLLMVVVCCLQNSFPIFFLKYLLLILLFVKLNNNLFERMPHGDKFSWIL